MVKDDLWRFHQTPQKLAKDLIGDIDFTDVKNIYEPFAGQGKARLKTMKTLKILILTQTKFTRSFQIRRSN